MDVDKKPSPEMREAGQACLRETVTPPPEPTPHGVQNAGATTSPRQETGGFFGDAEFPQRKKPLGADVWGGLNPAAILPAQSTSLQMHASRGTGPEGRSSPSWAVTEVRTD